VSKLLDISTTSAPLRERNLNQGAAGSSRAAVVIFVHAGSPAAGLDALGSPSPTLHQHEPQMQKDFNAKRVDWQQWDDQFISRPPIRWGINE
jgi:hypothetical protein